LLQSFLNDFYLAGLVVLAFTAVAWMGIHYLRYAEFMLAGQMLRTGEFQRSLNARLHLSSLETAIAKSKSMEDCWENLLTIYQTFGFAAVRMHISGRTYEVWDPQVAAPNYWTLKIPLSDRDYVELAREFGSPVLPMVAVPFVDLMASTLSAKLEHCRKPAAAETAELLQQGN
jgi:hypothetical protein